MKRYQAESIGDILRQALEDGSNSRRYAEITAINSWPGVVGATLAAKTLRPVVKNGVMTIKVPSATLRQELNMMRTALTEAVNNEVGKPAITEIKFI